MTDCRRTFLSTHMTDRTHQIRSDQITGDLTTSRQIRSAGSDSPGPESPAGPEARAALHRRHPPRRNAAGNTETDHPEGNTDTRGSVPDSGRSKSSRADTPARASRCSCGCAAARSAARVSARAPGASAPRAPRARPASAPPSPSEPNTRDNHRRARGRPREIYSTTAARDSPPMSGGGERETVRLSPPNTRTHAHLINLTYLFKWRHSMIFIVLIHS